MFFQKLWVNRNRFLSQKILAFVWLLVIVGCSEEDPAIPPGPSEPNVISEFVDICYEEGVHVEEMNVSLRLVLDTLNLPSAIQDREVLVLGVDPENPFGRRISLEYNFSGQLSEQIDPGLIQQMGWKVAIQNATASRCTTCFTNDGLARVILLAGNLNDVEFEYDPEDTLGIFIDSGI